MIERLVGVLGDKLDLTAEEIADILWLGMLKWQSMPSLPSPEAETTSLFDQERAFSDPASVVDDAPPPLNSSVPPPSPPPAGLQSGRTPPPDESSTERVNLEGVPISLPDAPALRGTLALLRALKPLLRKVPSVQGSSLDEMVTAQRIAETDLWIPELQPELEPWLDLALVIDASPSMLIWQRSVRDVQRLLRQCGAFRDVRVWSLDIGSTGDVCLRPGYGAMAAGLSPCSPRELIDPSGRRLIWVMSDCIDDHWQTGVVHSTLAIWADQGPMALVQVLPEWLWDRTALQGVAKVRFYGLEPGVANQALRVKRRDRWRRSSTTDIKVPVLTLEPSVAERWSQMMVGKGATGAAGVVLSQIPQSSLDLPALSPQERVERFRVFSSPTARRLAALLSACPIVTLPIIRMVQAAMLSDSDQVHVAEVLLGGLFSPIASVANFANPEEVEYTLQDAETRQILLGDTPPADTFQILSRWISQRLGRSLDEFVALLQNPQQSGELGNQVQTFAGVTVDVLKRQGGRYTKIAETIESQWFKGRDTEPGAELEQNKDWLLDTLEVLEFETAQLVEASTPSFPPLQDGEVEVVTIILDDRQAPLVPSLDWQQFEFEVATLERRPRQPGIVGNLFQRGGQRNEWVIRKQRQQRVGLWVEPLDRGINLEMVLIPGGTFVMGSTESEPERNSAEGPQHEVSLELFMMGRYPITQAQWRVVAALPQVDRQMNSNPSGFKRENRPVETVSWYDAVEFCERLSAYTGRTYRLPSEAEWEYACRAGTITPFSFGETITTDIANYNGNYSYSSGPKGIYRQEPTLVDHFGVANAFGLCDMHGNVREWCQDHWHDNYAGAPTDGSVWLIKSESAFRRVIRSGSWNNDPRTCRSAARDSFAPDFRHYIIGFRVVCDVPNTFQ